MASKIILKYNTSAFWLSKNPHQQKNIPKIKINPNIQKSFQGRKSDLWERCGRDWTQTVAGFFFRVPGVDLCLINLIYMPTTQNPRLSECRSKYFWLYRGNLNAACSKSAEDRCMIQSIVSAEFYVIPRSRLGNFPLHWILTTPW